MTRTALWLVPVADIGGVARHVLDVARAGIPGWELVVLCPEGELAARLRRTDIRVLTGDFGTSAGLLRSVGTLRRAIREIAPEIVHAHLAYADVVAACTLLPRRILGRLPGIKPGPILATTEHGIAPEDAAYQSSPLRGRIMRAAHRLRLCGTDRIIAVCESTRRVMEQKWGARGVQVVRNGVDVEAVRRQTSRSKDRSGTRPADGPRFLTLSRLAPEKQISVVITAFERIHRRNPDARLVVAGAGPQEQQLRSLARRLAVASAVDFPGFVEPYAALADADVLVQISEWENYSYTLLDAAAAGVPTVANDVGGNAEILPPSLPAGRLEPDAVAHAMLEAAAAPRRDGAEALVSLQSLDMMTAGIAEVYGRGGGDRRRCADAAGRAKESSAAVEESRGGDR